MAPKKTSVIDPMAEGHPDPFADPRTIPTGWEVSAFYGPEQSYPYQPDMYGHTSVKAVNNPYGPIENTL
jgi:hypothetical protein